MTILPIPIPPQFLDAVGYPGEARLVALWWTSLGDTACYDDGRTSGTGDAWAYLAFARHPALAPHLAGWELGSSEGEGRHRLLLDAGAGTVRVGSAAGVRAALRAQWPLDDGIRPAAAAVELVLEEVRRAWASRPMPTAEQLVASMRRHAAVVAEMVRWLDHWMEERS